MTVMIFDDLEQGSDDWLELRRGTVTASVIGQLITPKTVKVASNATSRALVAKLAAERITGRVPDQYVSRDMERGWYDEPLARDFYAEHTEQDVTEVGFMLREGDGYKVGYSPDGLVGETGLIEIKSREPKHHLQTILAGEVPAEYRAQIQCGLYVSGRDWCDYISWCGGMRPFVLRVPPDGRWQAAIAEAAEAAYAAIAAICDEYRHATEGMPETEYIDHFAEPELILS